MERTVGGVLVSRRLAGAGLDPARVKELTRELDMKTIRISETGEREDQGAAMVLALILLMILYVSILMWGQTVMTSVIEEKTSRVVEVMASGVPPTTLLMGKLLGVGAAGLTQFLVWSSSLFGVSAVTGGAIAGQSMPEITPLMLVSFVVFFLLGFFFYASLYAAIGSAVNTVQEAQRLRVAGDDADHPGDGLLARGARSRRTDRSRSRVDDPGHVAAHHVPAHRGAHAADVADPAVDRAARSRDPRRSSGSRRASTGSAS